NAGRPLAPVGGVVVEQQAALAPVEHVDDDDHVTLSSQLSGNAVAGVVLLLECRQDGVLVRAVDQLLLAPQVEAAVVVQGNYGRCRESGLLRDEDACGYAEVGRGVEVDLL